MLKYIIPCIVLLSLLPLVRTTAEAPVQEVPYQQTEWTVDEVKALVDKYADKYSVSRTLMHKVVKCESGYKYNAVNWNDSHRLSKGSHGVAQFSKETFIGFANQMGKSYNDPYNAEQALDVASWAISKGYGRHWSCFNK